VCSQELDPSSLAKPRGFAAVATSVLSSTSPAASRVAGSHARATSAEPEQRVDLGGHAGRLEERGVVVDPQIAREQHEDPHAGDL
jgi:hypothetical protein